IFRKENVNIIKNYNLTLYYNMPPKGAKKGKRKAKNLTKVIKDVVREQLAVELEEKVAVIGENNEVIGTPFIPDGDVTLTPSLSNFVKIFPLISQGLGQYNERVGNEIRLKSIDIKMLLTYHTMAFTNTTDSSIGVRVMILRQKDQNSQLGALEDFQGNKLLENGAIAAPGPAPFDGRAFNLIQKINREQFSVRYDKVFYLDAPYIQPGGTDATRVYTQPPRPKVVNHTLRFGKQGLKLTYGDGASDNPTNFPYLLVMGYASLVSNGNPSVGLFTYSYTANAKYTDA
uniref:hypothetical protein n=1 Tax=Yoonia sp. TaxID=2212373 RepID=UPI0040472DEA